MNDNIKILQAMLLMAETLKNDNSYKEKLIEKIQKNIKKEAEKV